MLLSSNVSPRPPPTTPPTPLSLHCAVNVVAVQKQCRRFLMLSHWLGKNHCWSVRGHCSLLILKHIRFLETQMLSAKATTLGGWFPNHVKVSDLFQLRCFSVWYVPLSTGVQKLLLVWQIYCFANICAMNPGSIIRHTSKARFALLFFYYWLWFKEFFILSPNIQGYF